MLLHNRLYLSDAAAQDQASERNALFGLRKTLWILPRAWCATASIQAKGIPRHKTAEFVRLHLTRLAPFVDSGAYACRSGDWVFLWFWENQRVREFCQRNELDFDSITVAPESVCFPKRQEGTVLYRCSEGVEAQLWHQGRLVDSAWWPGSLDATTWAEWQPTAAASAAGRGVPVSWPESLPHIVNGSPGDASLNKPWASNLLAPQWWTGLKTVRLGASIVLLSALLVGYAGYLATQWLTLQRMQNDVDKKIEALSSRIDPLQAARAKALEYQYWTAQIARLAKQNGIRPLLESFKPILLQQEAALREFELSEDEVRMMLVPMVTELNIAAIIQQLEALPNLANIQLLPNSDPRAMRLTAKLRKFGVPASAGEAIKPAKSEVSK
ncbi:MAG: hypothetical protein HYS18_10330 [Burkholderiales bacterium]|nr:hypothetical protein [Burkholderiales bacterium]